MIIYNITVKVNNGILHDWLQWQLNEHIPEIMNTGLFNNYKFFKLLEQDESEGATFVVQFDADSMSKYNQYINEYAPLLRDKAMVAWCDQFIAFRTVMESVR
ncbi:DUF4286 family protein [soil metagenome]